MLKSLFKPIIDWYLAILKAWGYPAIALFMAIESSIVPLPSEVVIPPAAHLAYTKQIPLTIWGVIIAGIIGSWLGASVMYWASRLAGRPLAIRYGRYVMITKAKIEGAERWAKNYGSMGVFMSRLLPVVRHLIGIPAGIVRMNYWKYSLFTILGATVWCSVLAYIGVKMGQDEQLMKGEMHRLVLWLGGLSVGLGVIYYVFVYRQMKGKGKAGG